MPAPAVHTERWAPASSAAAGRMAGGRRVTVLLVRALCCAATIATASAQVVKRRRAFSIFRTSTAARMRACALTGDGMFTPPRRCVGQAGSCAALPCAPRVPTAHRTRPRVLARARTQDSPARDRNRRLPPRCRLPFPCSPRSTTAQTHRREQRHDGARQRAAQAQNGERRAQLGLSLTRDTVALRSAFLAWLRANGDGFDKVCSCFRARAHVQNAERGTERVACLRASCRSRSTMTARAETP